MIDPNIWASEDMAKLSLRQRIMVIGLFSNADDHGKGKAKPAYLRSTIFPYDDIPLSEIIDDLETIRAVISVEFYVVEGNSYYRFLNWNKWQTVQKPQASLIPEPVENDSGMILDSFSPKGKERKGKEEKSENDSGLESIQERIRLLVNECKLKNVGIDGLETIYSYIGQADVEVIERAIRKAAGKYVQYFVTVMNGFLEEGKTTKQSILPYAPPSNREAEFQARLAEERKTAKPVPLEPEIEALKEVAAGYESPGPRTTGSD